MQSFPIFLFISEKRDIKNLKQEECTAVRENRIS